MSIPAYKDPKHEGNGERYRTGKRCIGHPRGFKCDEPAGTKWSPHWCFDCNVKRIDGINASLDRMLGPRQEEMPV